VSDLAEADPLANRAARGPENNAQPRDAGRPMTVLQAPSAPLARHPAYLLLFPKKTEAAMRIASAALVVAALAGCARQDNQAAATQATQTLVGQTRAHQPRRRRPEKLRHGPTRGREECSLSRPQWAA
jgi:hypothetical protein